MLPAKRQLGIQGFFAPASSSPPAPPSSSSLSSSTSGPSSSKKIKLQDPVKETAGTNSQNGARAIFTSTSNATSISSNPSNETECKVDDSKESKAADEISTTPLKKAVPTSSFFLSSSAKKAAIASTVGGVEVTSSSNKSDSIVNTSATLFSTFDFTASLSLDPLTRLDLQPWSERELLDLECDTMHESWLALLQNEIKKPYFLRLKGFLWKEGVRGVLDSNVTKVFPPARDIYSWSRYTPIHKVKVVVIGQDPYHNDGQAHGLSFSVRPGVPVPASLRNMYKEIKSEYPSFNVPKHGNLISWAESGVLLLNTSLTVRAHEAGSHSKKGWEEFTDKIVHLIDKFGGSEGVGQLGKGVVFLAWGAWAAKRVATLDKTKHLILTSAHPSPLSASRGFLGNGHFKTANIWLEKRYGASSKVDWTRLDVTAGQVTKP